MAAGGGSSPRATGPAAAGEKNVVKVHLRSLRAVSPSAYYAPPPRQPWIEMSGRGGPKTGGGASSANSGPRCAWVFGGLEHGCFRRQRTHQGAAIESETDSSRAR